MLFRKPAGPFVVTVFSEPDPVRVGVADLSVMVETASDQNAVLDANANLHLRKAEDGRIIELVAPATHGGASNKLLYAASIRLPSAGTWKLTVEVRSQGRDGSASGELKVLAPEPPVMAHWPLFVIVPVMILFFVLNQWLKSRRGLARRQLRQ